MIFNSMNITLISILVLDVVLAASFIYIMMSNTNKDKKELAALMNGSTAQCDHIYFVYSTTPVLSSCSLCGKEHPYNSNNPALES